MRNTWLDAWMEKNWKVRGLPSVQKYHCVDDERNERTGIEKINQKVSVSFRSCSGVKRAGGIGKNLSRTELIFF